MQPRRSSSKNKMKAHKSSACHKILFFLLLAILVWAPMPFGSNTDWAAGLLSSLVFVLAGAWLLGYGAGQLTTNPVFFQARYFHICFLLLCGWTGLQGVYLPADWVETISPQAWALHQQAADTLGQALPASMTLSLDVQAANQTFLLTAAFYLLFCLTLLLANTGKRLNQLAWAIVISGTFQAIFGSLSTLSGAEVLLFAEKETYLGVATGTFVNRNSYAGYLEMTLAVGVGLLISKLGDNPTQGWRQWLQAALQTLMSNKVLLRSALAIMVIGLVLSRSRMGNTAFFSSLLIVGLLYVVVKRKLTRGMVILFTSMILIDVAIVSQWFGIEKVVERLEQTSMDKESRPEVSDITLGMIQDYPVAGTGGGSFYTALPGYHNGSWKGFYDLAHNDILQFALEFGLPAYALLMMLVLMAFWQGIKAMQLRRQPLMVGMGFASTMGILAIMIHSFVDFNLQMPANGATFTILLAIACLARHLKSQR